MPAWGLIQYNKFKENKEKYMEYLNNMPTTSIYYIYKSLSECFKQNYNLKILEFRKEQLKRKLKWKEELKKQDKQPKKVHYSKFWYEGVEYDYNFHINAHIFTINEWSITNNNKSKMQLKKKMMVKYFLKYRV